MIAYLDTNTGDLRATQGGSLLTTITAKRGEDFDLEIVPDRDLDAATVGYFSAKSVYGGVLMVHGTWTAPTVSGRGWLFSLSLNGGSLAAAFAGSLEKVPLLAETTVFIGGKVRKSQTIEMVIQREVYTGTEDAPAQAAQLVRIGATGHHEYYLGGQWWRWAPALNEDNKPEFQWIGPIAS